MIHPQPIILSAEDSAFWRSAYMDAFIDTASEHYQRSIASPTQFSDGIHHTGYLWECLRSWSRITIERFHLELVKHQKVFVQADDHSRDNIPGAPLWPFPAYSVVQFPPEQLWTSLDSLPEDIYVFDSTLRWTLILTHEHDAKRRICCAVGMEK